MADDVILRDCPLCDLPMEVISTWRWKVSVFEPDGKVWQRVEKSKCTARCLNDHWYAGDLEDLKGAVP